MDRGSGQGAGIPVFYFVPPQLWAWAGWRVRKVQKYVDQVLCSLPFEPAWYHARGVSDAVYVGHPYFDELADRSLDDGFLAEHRGRPGPLVAILPGSRTQELVRNLPDMIKAARELARRRPDVRFAVACLHDRHKAMAERMIAESSAREKGSAGPDPAITVFAARTPELIRLARLAWAVSGSVGLELMADGLPSVVLYKVKRFDLWVARHFIKSKYISLVNLLADEEVFPEYLTWQDATPDLVRWAMAWLDDTEERAGRPPPSRPCAGGSPSRAPPTAPPSGSSRDCRGPARGVRPRRPPRTAACTSRALASRPSASRGRTRAEPSRCVRDLERARLRPSFFLVPARTEPRPPGMMPGYSDTS